jgi:hypothetical protein
VIDQIDRRRKAREENNFIYLAVALVVLLLGLATIREIGIALREGAVAGALLAALATPVGSILSGRRD